MNGDQLVREAISLVLARGRRSAPRGKPVIELTKPIVLTLPDPHKPLVTTPARRANYRFGMTEALWIASGSEDVETVARHNKRMAEFSDNEKTLWGAYGPRVVGQLPHVIETLRRDADSRQAVLTTWRPMVGPVDGDSPRLKAAGLSSDTVTMWDGASWRSKDVPCTVAWHFMIRDGRLNLTVFMRSNDAWLGTPYDILSFTTVQRLVAAILGVKVGEYHHVPSNLHLYEENLEQARAFLDGEPGPEVTLPAFEPSERTIECVVKSCRDLLDYHTVPIHDPGLRAYAAVMFHRSDLWPAMVNVPVR